MNNIIEFSGVSPILGQRVYVDDRALVLGKVTLGDDVSVWPGAVLRGDMEAISVGARSNIQDNAVLHTTHGSRFFAPCPLSIGEEVILGHAAVVHGCTIGNNVLVGIGAIINDRVLIEDEVIIGAGSVIPPGKQLQGGHVYVGNPARLRRSLTAEEKRFLKYSPNNYVALKNQYLVEFRSS